ncbi:hypothetical protein RHGRI_025078 [Rhododendron griersonianum]|uniref:Uncharacterized protein n=1 Tax=Rhododendron griersonianum TaxID=479676 RepID=A0AAV6JF52_9ERIC|nr:hypothetical protein RHGRI_025078 [Rhododendron griersonianum]
MVMGRRRRRRRKRKVAEPWLVLVAVASVITGYFIGSSFHKVLSNKIQMPTLNYNVEDDKHTIKFDSDPSPCPSQVFPTHNITGIYVATNPRGAESLPPGIVEPYSDFYLHKQQENSTEFSENFSIVLFHYDGRTSEWDQFEWSHRAIHISARKQAKWWYAKRFLHPDIVSDYEYIFIWDEDLGVDHFNAEEYLKLVKKHDLEISQPGIEQKTEHSWLMTKRRRPYEKIGVVDAQWVEHKKLPSLGDQGLSSHGRPPWEGGYDVVAIACPERYVVGVDLSDKAIKKSSRAYDKSDIFL